MLSFISSIKSLYFQYLLNLKDFSTFKFAFDFNLSKKLNENEKKKPKRNGKYTLNYNVQYTLKCGDELNALSVSIAVVSGVACVHMCVCAQPCKCHVLN